MARKDERSTRLRQACGAAGPQHSTPNAGARKAAARKMSQESRNAGNVFPISRRVVETAESLFRCSSCASSAQIRRVLRRFSGEMIPGMMRTGSLRGLSHQTHERHESFIMQILLIGVLRAFRGQLFFMNHRRYQHHPRLKLRLRWKRSVLLG